jgi:flagellar motor switch protein FliN/FliY
MTVRPHAEALEKAADDRAMQHDIAMTSRQRRLIPIDSEVFRGVQIALQAKLGRADLSVTDLLALQEGSVVKLDTTMNDLVELKLNGSLIARGEIVAVDDHFGVRIVEIAQIS